MTDITKALNQFYGWFDDPEQPPDQPSFDPPHNGPCLYCGRSITPEDVRTHSLMRVGRIYAKRSYFYRTHRTCDEASEVAINEADTMIFAMIDRNGD